MTRLDVLEMKINIAELEMPNDNLIKRIISDEMLDKMNCHGLDIVFIIERCTTPVTNNVAEELLYEYINNLINKIAELSKNSYSDDELLLLKKYAFYKFATTYLDMAERKNKFISDIENIMTISVTSNNAIWFVKENLRIILLDLYTNFGLLNINRIKELLEIVKANNDKRQDFQTNILNKIYMS